MNSGSRHVIALVLVLLGANVVGCLRGRTAEPARPNTAAPRPSASAPFNPWGYD